MTDHSGRQNDSSISSDEFRQYFSDSARILLSLMSMAAFLGWSYVALFFLAWSGFPTRADHGLLLLFPFAYLIFCVYSCFSTMRRRFLISSGVLFNLPLVGTILYFTIQDGVKSAGILMLILAFPSAWALMCTARIRAKEIPI